MNVSKKTPNIVIVGGGAGGLELASKLGNKLGKSNKASITLVDCTLTHTWKPLLHEVASGTLNSYEDKLSYLSIANKNNFTFRLGGMKELDRKKQIIHLSPTLDKNGLEYIPERSFHYDILVIAVGSQTNDFKIKGIKEHCMFIDTRQDAEKFHHNLLRCAYEADTQANPLRKGQLKIAIAGAGATGVELSAELHDSFRQLATFGLNNISIDNDVKITIIEAAENILPALPIRLSKATENALKNINVDLLTNCRIIEANKEGFITDKGDLVPSEIKVWAAGIKAPDFLKNIDGLETNQVNQLIVQPTLQTTLDQNIFAIGDCASCQLWRAADPVPPRAQAAHQQADILVKTIINLINSKPPLIYKYVDYGSLINLSRYSTVGNMMGNLLGKKAQSVMIEGLIARFVYLSLYKIHQLVIQGVIRVTLTTFSNFLTQKIKPRMKLH